MHVLSAFADRTLSCPHARSLTLHFSPSQFAYVSNNGCVVTVSDAFHIGVPLEGDPEFIEIPSTDGMESMLMIDTETSAVKKKLDERHRENEELRSEWQGQRKWEVDGGGWGERGGKREGVCVLGRIGCWPALVHCC